MTVSINDVINTTDDTTFNSFDLFLQENPHYLTSLDDDGQTPLHVAVQGGDLRLIQTLIKRGAKLDQANIRGDSALRMATKLNNYTVVKYLAKNSTDLSTAFKYTPDLKEDRVELVFMFLGVWLLVSVLIMSLAVMISVLVAVGCTPIVTGWASYAVMAAANAVFLSTFITCLWISAIVAAVIGLIITLYLAYNYLEDNYIKAPGYLGKQQTKLLEAIDSNQLSAINVILAENINWLFSPITLFHNSAMLLLAKTEEGRHNLISIMSQVAQSDSALNNLFSSEDHKQLLLDHPELLRALVDSLSLASIVQYKQTLFDAFFANIDFFRENSQDSTNMFAKLTVCGMGWEGDDSFGFIPQALHSQNTAMAHSSKGYIAKCGWYGASQNNAEAITAFKSVGRENLTLYINAQKELAVLNLVASGSEGLTEADRIPQFFQGLSHYHNVLSSSVDVTNQTAHQIQDAVKEYLTDLLDRDSVSCLFSDLVNTNRLTWKTEEGDTPILLAAKLGYWELVELIIQQKPESIDTEQYGQLLLTAISVKEVAIVDLLVKHPAFREKSAMVIETENSPCHEAIRVGSVDILGLLLASNQDLSHPNKEGLTPIAFAANLGCWDMVRKIAESHSTDFADAYRYQLALAYAVCDQETETVRCLITHGVLQTPSYISPIKGNSPCHLAIFNNDEGILKQLLASNQDLSHQNKEGDDTPIVLAAKLGHWHLVKAILEAHPTTSDDKYQYGKALFLAINAKQVDVVHGLVNRGALRGQFYIDPDTGDSSWHAAVKQNSLEMLKCLLDKTDSPVARLYQDKNKKGETVFALSAKYDDMALSALIVQNYPNDKFRFFGQTNGAEQSDLQLLSEPRAL